MLSAETPTRSIEAFAAILQRTLLPPALPAVPGLELACHYATASPRDVGGDFYDVFPLDGGRWVFVLGDVCGIRPGAAEGGRRRLCSTGCRPRGPAAVRC
ncbi:hypothetical protein [Streptomyces sp. NPDC006334]|uniref:PP2C family protein-serine/threonine phosphatase n=1 Tax=Streptomyces sp. NPDC006334 TaxID=3156754 RepID=UPI0033A6A216